MRRNLLAENHLIQMDGFDTDLIRLAEQNPSNKAAFHYAGVFYLLAKDVTRFKTLVETYYGTDLLPSLPVSFQEAVGERSGLLETFRCLGIYRRAIHRL